MSGRTLEAVVGFVAIGASFIPGIGPVVSMGLMYAGATLVEHAMTPRVESLGIEQQAMMQNDIGTTNPIPVVYGEVRLAVVVADYRVYPPNNTALYVPGVLSHGGWVGHGIDSIREVYFDEKMAFNAAGVAQAPFTELVTKAVNKYLGTTVQNVDPNLNLAFATAWPSTSSGRPLAYIVVIVDPYKQELFSGGIPNITAKIRGVKVLDPRTIATITTTDDSTDRVNTSAAHGLLAGDEIYIEGVVGGSPNINGRQVVWDVPTSTSFRLDGGGFALNITANASGGRVGKVSWSQNPALCIYDYLRSTVYGCGVASTEIDDQSFIDAANFCDASVTVPNGSGGTTTQARFRCDGVLDTNRLPDSNLEELLATCRGQLIYDGSKFVLHIRQAMSPTGFKLNANNIVEGSFKWHKPSTDEAPNLIIGQFVNPAKNDQVDEVQFPDVGVTNTYLTEDNDFESKTEVQLRMVRNPYQTRQILMVTLKEMRWGVPFECLCDESILSQRPGDLIEVTHATCGWTDKPAWIVGMSIPPDSEGQIRVVGFTYDPNMYSYDAQDDEPALPVTDLPDPFTVAAPTNLRAFSGTGDPRIRVEWDAANEPYLFRYEVRAKRTGPAGMAESEYHSYGRLTPDDRSIYIPVTQDGEEWAIDVSSISLTGRRSSWVSVNHTVNTTPSAAFTHVVTALQDSIEYDITFGENCHYVEFFSIENAATGGVSPAETSEYAAGYVQLKDGATVKKVISTLASNYRRTLMVGYDQQWRAGQRTLIETQALAAGGSGPSGPPTAITETADTPSSVTFGWDNGDATASDTRIYVDGILMRTQPIGDARTYTKTGLAPSQTICVELSHIKNGLESTKSAPVYMSSAAPGAGPTNFVEDVGSCNDYWIVKHYVSRRLTWDTLGGGQKYEVKESNVSTLGSGVTILDQSSATEVIVEKLVGSAAKYYSVRGVNPETQWTACADNPITWGACT